MIAAGRIIRAQDAIGLTGQIVARLRRIATQAIANATHTSVIFDQVDLDLLGGWSSGAATRYTPPLAGRYLYNCRAVYESNSTSRRGCWVNLNGTTGGTGTICGESVQAPATGTAQVGGMGAASMNGTSDYVEMRVFHNAGVSLNLQTESTDGGSTLEIFYAGPL